MEKGSKKRKIHQIFCIETESQRYRDFVETCMAKRERDALRLYSAEWDSDKLLYPLWLSLYGEMPHLALELLKCSDLDVNYMVDHNRTPLIMANAKEVVVSLLKHPRIDVNVCGRLCGHRATALDRALNDDLWWKVALLLKDKRLKRHGVPPMCLFCRYTKNRTNNEIKYLAKHGYYPDYLYRHVPDCPKRHTIPIIVTWITLSELLPPWQFQTTAFYYPPRFTLMAKAFLLCCKRKRWLCKDIRHLIIHYLAEMWKTDERAMREKQLCSLFLSRAT